MTTQKSIFITGGSSGIGESLCLKYLSSNFIVGTCGRSKEKFLSSSIYNKENLHFFELDVCDEEKSNLVINSFIEKFGLN